MPESFSDLVSLEKTLVLGVSWQGPDSTGELQFVAPLEIKGRTIRGLFLRGGCYVEYPDEAVKFQLELAQPGLRKREPLSRVEWRPLRQPHKNDVHRDPALSRRLVWGSHVHPFEANWVRETGLMRSGNLPYAVEITPDLSDFDKLIDFVAKHFRINGLEKIERPGWMQRLL